MAELSAGAMLLGSGAPTAQARCSPDRPRDGPTYGGYFPGSGAILGDADHGREAATSADRLVIPRGAGVEDPSLMAASRLPRVAAVLPNLVVASEYQIG